MNFLVFSAACVAVVAAGYDNPPAQDGPYSEPHPPQQEGYPPSGPSYPSLPGPYPGGYDDDKGRFRKLRNLRIQGVVDGRKRYFTHRGEDFVAISCPQSSTSTYTWLLADSRKTIPNFGIQGTVALAGGLNVEYVARLGHHGKWEGRDILDDRQRFRRVGCYQGSLPSGLGAGITE